ncbi:hypothetical protein Meth11DRAFT_1741 [Methylophilaceae bacterium 11]|jgi:hypothetical protein|uniref:hypothetical protein n=1 Tax=Methylotenera sp. 1P/1 TaxID=1131551 RepID=UPI00035CC693|nr:hypothetical protein [Methylotenera sp. 1P/1]EUJ10910.1 hypothetical protein Meth11DRAFT_1741 [Methylophilaceae bacterium 11]
MPSNLYVLPAYGKAITLDDQGVFYVMNQYEDTIQSVIQLSYARDEWCLMQLQHTSVADEYCWTVMAEDSRYALNSMTSSQIAHHFARPEFAEPKGAWQVIRNQQYGFGKFTPLEANQQIAYALLMFEQDEIKAVIRLHRMQEDMMQTIVEETVEREVEFA